ncbi:MAG: hypothetical protein IPO67_23370 [Deltaproteobacteria bacterium]|nr:hypothetical protein [Deltaproteobacteria bacterium]
MPAEPTPPPGPPPTLVRDAAGPRPRPAPRRRAGCASLAPSPRRPAPGRREDSDAPAGGVDPSIPLNAEGISSVFPQLRESIAECIDAWAEVDPSISGSVVLTFSLGPDGVQDAWVSERRDMPAAVTGCFSTAVYEQAWPPAPGGIEVSLPFEVDAGLTPAEPGSALKDRRGEAPPPPAED